MGVRRGVAGLAVASVLGTAVARADGPGLYGEMTGALTLGVSGGGGVTGSGSAPVVVGQLDLFFLSTAGIKVGYHGFATGLAPGLDLSRHRTTIDVDFRPLFLWMFFTDRFTEREAFDLFLYSFGLEVGFAYERATLSGGSLDDPNAYGVYVGAGFEVPLWRRSGHGLHLRVQVRASFLGSARLGPDAARIAGRMDAPRDVVEVGLLLRYRFQFWENL